MTDALPVLPGFAHLFAEVGTEDGEGLRLHYVEGGPAGGAPLVLLHGWPETWFAWRKVAPALADAGCHVIVPDLRGFGDSARPEGGYDRLTMAGDIHRLVRDVLRWQRVFLAGHDWGGSTATAYATAWPDEVRRLAVIEALPQGPWTDRAAEPWFYGFHRIPGFAEAVTQGREREYLSWFYGAFARDPGVISAVEIDEYLRTYAQPGGMRPGFELVRALPTDIENNRRAMQHPYPGPALAVGAARSMGAKVAENLRHLAADVRPVVVPESNHFVLEDQPDEMARLLLSFFGEER